MPPRSAVSCNSWEEDAHGHSSSRQVVHAPGLQPWLFHCSWRRLVFFFSNVLFCLLKYSLFFSRQNRTFEKNKTVQDSRVIEIFGSEMVPSAQQFFEENNILYYIKYHISYSIIEYSLGQQSRIALLCQHPKHSGLCFLIFSLNCLCCKGPGVRVQAV